MIWIYKTFVSAEQPLDLSIDAPAVGEDVVQLNSTLQAVTLDSSLFTSAAYRGLIDFSVEVPVQPMGRKNPFNPIGVDQGFPTITATNSGR